MHLHGGCVVLLVLLWCYLIIGTSWMTWMLHCQWCWKLVWILFLLSMWCFPWKFLLWIYLLNILLVWLGYHLMTSSTSQRFTCLLLLILLRMFWWSQHIWWHFSDLVSHGTKIGDTLYLLWLVAIRLCLFWLFLMLFWFSLRYLEFFVLTFHVALVCLW